MDANNQELGAPAQEVVSMDALVQEHRTLDEKVSELSGRSFLSPEDDMELARLKKEKLRLKDLISELSQVKESA